MASASGIGSNDTSSGNSPASIAFTVFFIVIGTYLIFKYHKEPGFWWGFFALFILGFRVTVNN